MDFLSFVQEARSCRRFVEEKALQTADLDWLVTCARYTPSARNAQVIRFVEVLGKTCAAMFPMTKWAMALKDWGGPKPGERPSAFLALVLPKDHSPLALVDCGIVSQTIQLAAHSRGWGTCIIKSFQEKEVAELLAVPESMTVALVLGLGVALEKRVACDVPESGSLNYWRDSEGTHYVPKHALDTLVLGRFA